MVDDEVLVRKIHAEVLSRSGYQTETAEDGAAAWEALQADGYHLLITDNHMPKVSGIELVKKMRSAHITLPVILASGAMPTEELDRYPWLQLAATLLKPFTDDELLETVKRVLRETDSAREQGGSQSPAAEPTPMVKHFAPHMPLPCRADRQKLIEQAQRVVAEARATADQLDRSFAPLSVELPAECTAAVSSSVETGAAGRFL
ncbi:MAG TPA: response regulator [Verrucomicrobiae bacterium]